jgi:hypothetical protein
MTPYVLDDAEVAQLEASRRKSVLSDPMPWDDHGWSASALADPVPQKEQLRRLKDEWKKQDAERQTRRAIEQEKLNRARKLKELSAEELVPILRRRIWILSAAVVILTLMLGAAAAGVWFANNPNTEKDIPNIGQNFLSSSSSTTDTTEG